MKIKDIKKDHWYETKLGVGKCLAVGGTHPPSVVVEIIRPIPRGRMNVAPAEVVWEVADPTIKNTLPEKTLQERIESLTYYGLGNEAYELFQAACVLCRQASGLGQDRQAEFLCMWAEELAEASANDIDNGVSPLTDTARGHWGYR